MRHSSQSLTKVVVSVLGLLALVGFGTPREAAADEVFDWNVTGFDATVAGGQNNVVISRTMAMMHLAVHDALNAIDRRYEPKQGRPLTPVRPLLLRPATSWSG